jgi:hypothetical protein
MEPEERRKQMRPQLEDERLFKSASDRWLPVSPDDVTSGDIVAVAESGEPKLLHHTLRVTYKTIFSVFFINIFNI